MKPWVHTQCCQKGNQKKWKENSSKSLNNTDYHLLLKLLYENSEDMREVSI
jgi:hypothetical protein